MTCYHPIKACYSKSDYAKYGKKHLHILIQSDSKEAVLLNHRDYPTCLYEYILIPCRKCAGCASDKAKEWSLRAIQECSIHNDNCFITLTYDNLSTTVQKDPECLRTLRYKHFQNFMKRLRKFYNKDKIGYMVCGEYGHKDGRAHWHAILFGFDFPDKELVYIKDGYRHFTSPSLVRLWSDYNKSTGEFSPIGFIDLANVDNDCCNYVSQYVLKKLPVGEKGEIYDTFVDKDGNVNFIHSNKGDRVAPFVRTSRNPAIGLNWYKKDGSKSVRNGYVTLLDRKRNLTKRIKTPEYYNKKFEEVNPDEFKIIKECKEEKMKKFYANRPLDREKLRSFEESHLYRIASKLKSCLTKYL